tara:strand:+ start:247 stop:438 length:192 start_codon:yes stop_codon:yes gene_type:complete
MKRITCRNNHEIAIIPVKDQTITAAYITNPRLKHLKDGDVLKECPNCKVMGKLIERKIKPQNN